jgi:16S rRNA (cytosine1402-N4)-methyltransferase
MTTPEGDSAFDHVPVMLDRVVALLTPALGAPDAVCLDATLGRGGHARTLLDDLPGLRVIGVDRDAEAIERSRARLADHADRVTYVHARFDEALAGEVPAALLRLGLPAGHGVQGALFDLGVSSPQLDDTERGFAYSQDAPLDMRMDARQELTAAAVVNTYPAADIARVLRDYGEERFARRVADAIVAERTSAPFTGTARLADVVRTAIPAATRRTGGHPAKRAFQALRIEVNGELAAVTEAVPAALRALTVGGRVVVMAYHSLEDRIVKRAFADATTDKTPQGLPVPLPEHEPEFRSLTRGAEQPSADESERNPRAASARLRAVERVRAGRSNP